MTDDDPLRDAVAELYSSDPGEFVERRTALVARARAAGQAQVARQIAGLRKPTRSAWIINQLVRAEPGVTSELASLGEQLRAAQVSLDGEALRELSRRRRELVESLTRQAFTVSGQQAPAAGIRDEVTATFGAALADPQVAGLLATGALDRAAYSEGFAAAGPPDLTLVTGGGRGAGPSRTPRTPRAPRTESAPSADQERADQERAERERAERERRRRAALAEAEQAAAEADRAADAATAAEQELEATVERLEVQLADARRDLADARSRARRARARQHSARQALNRL